MLSRSLFFLRASILGGIFSTLSLITMTSAHPKDAESKPHSLRHTQNKATTPEVKITDQKPHSAQHAKIHNTFDDENDEEIPDDLPPNDPLQPLNRVIFGINQSLDAAILRPVTHMYLGLVPAGGRRAVGNFLQNLTEPISFLNHGFQQNTGGMKVTLFRFCLNSIMGFFGCFDVAKEVGYDLEKQTFMDTLHKAGLGPGPYLVLPLIGPSSLRDATGLLIDWIYDPVSYIIKRQNKDLPYYYRGARVIDKRAAMNDLIDSLNKAIDPYARYRLMYTEYRRGQEANIEDYEAPIPDANSHVPVSKPTPK